MTLARRISAVGLATTGAAGVPLDIWFPAPGREPSDRPCESVVVGDEERGDAMVDLLRPLAVSDPVCDVRRQVMRVTIDIHTPPRDFFDVWLRLHLLSHRLVKPREANVVGLIGLLNHDVAWTSLGPCVASALESVRLRARLAGQHLLVRSVFAVPAMLDYVTPGEVRIADATRVLLGAYLAPGTTVTPDGFCGFNAGTLGACMIEGRVSAGVVVHAGTHIGGGASLMGRVSGGNQHMVTIGERCLISANAGTGISLGDDCVIEAGCYVTAGLPVTLADGRVVKAIELAGMPRLTFRRNSLTGHLEALARASGWGQLNPHMHPGT
ncbi:2,3,4,5-tetrahydropyridine-2,6-dicarboxylate N-succinyltransferase [Luteibacter anthropi]|uniref:DapH/DapD/GlmU-related protein n=1 Tax=Luteibacter anthropi TaxID=564369 RepID=UPI0020323545|nr:DapH/DapD/GlmU-related protein [Luteibacter anthropi]URX63612.1 2,3,4,5-tetrahydropyridine-2,6-dicarboxylate N-succinyltransferase [Luteibacter anthropi]